MAPSSTTYNNIDLEEPLLGRKEKELPPAQKPVVLGAGVTVVPVVTKKTTATASTQTQPTTARHDDADDDDDEEEEFLLCGQDNEPVYRFNWCDSIMIWMVLPTLLWLDFSMAMLMDPEGIAGMVCYKVVLLSLAMFVVSSYLYRKVVEECRIDCLFLVLLPEIIMDAVLAIILSTKVVAAYLVLLFSILGLSTVVVAHSVYALWTNIDDDDEKEGNKDELDITYFKGGRVRSSSVEELKAVVW